MVDDSDQGQEPASGRNNPENTEFLFFWQNLFARIRRFVSDRQDVIRMDSDARIVRSNLLNLQIEGRFEHFWIAEHPEEVVEDNQCESIVDDELFSELLAIEEEWIRLQQFRDQFRKNTD
ncbi:hypothetical protein [Endozoicomonas sp. ALD040]|uniref:hypothetical protein n=1 Tax=unclassified Endozoicomonas TaxID=2644528 RepID=UPI003BAF32F7